MKSLSLFVSAAALLSATSTFAALDCGTLPTCASLGYNDDVNYCPKDSTGVVHAVKCPFDTSKVTCIHEAAVGQIAYFTKAPGKGWVPCNGSLISESNYPDLYKFLGKQFCTSDHGGDCGTDTVRVPKYSGYFLRVYGTPNTSYGKVGNTDLAKPQQEGLPNITANWRSAYEDQAKNYTTCTGALKDGCSEVKQKDESFEIPETKLGIGYLNRNFSAKQSNPIYGSSIGVTPPNYAVYAYMYAGRVAPSVQNTVLWTCDLCGYSTTANSAPTKCPTCNADPSHFIKN